MIAVKISWTGRKILTWNKLMFLLADNQNKLPNPTTAAEETSWQRYPLYFPGTCGRAGIEIYLGQNRASKV